MPSSHAVLKQPWAFVSEELSLLVAEAFATGWLTCSVFLQGASYRFRLKFEVASKKAFLSEKPKCPLRALRELVLAGRHI